MRRIGEKRENRKFTDAEALQIRREVRIDAVPMAQVAKKWGCCTRTVYEIVTRMCYKEVTEDLDWYACHLGQNWLHDKMNKNEAKTHRDWLAGKHRKKPKAGAFS